GADRGAPRRRIRRADARLPAPRGRAPGAGDAGHGPAARGAVDRPHPAPARRRGAGHRRPVRRDPRAAGGLQPHQCPRRGGGDAHRARLPVGALRQPGSPPGRRHVGGAPPGRGLKYRKIRRMDVFTLHRGSVPLLLSLPHDGSEIPPSLAARMTDAARQAPDTDWHVSRLYDFARELGASVLVPRFSRYVVGLNRPRAGGGSPPGLAARTPGAAPQAPNTDRPAPRPYDFARELGAPVLVPRFSRYGLDPSRRPDGTPLFPGQNTTGQCPAVRFS